MTMYKCMKYYRYITCLFLFIFNNETSWLRDSTKDTNTNKTVINTTYINENLHFLGSWTAKKEALLILKKLLLGLKKWTENIIHLNKNYINELESKIDILITNRFNKLENERIKNLRII